MLELDCPRKYVNEERNESQTEGISFALADTVLKPAHTVHWTGHLVVASPHSERFPSST